MSNCVNKYLPLFSFVIFFLGGCEHRRNFFEDPDNAGLSRLTSRGYNIVTLYLNDSAYINSYEHYQLGGAANSNVYIQKIPTSSNQDTLSINWDISYASATNENPDLSKLSILIPVDKNFSQSNFQSLQGQRLPINSVNNITMVLDRYNRQSISADTGSAIIYFVKVARDESKNPEVVYQFTGLFEGNAANNVVTKGRFDFLVSATSLNF